MPRLPPQDDGIELDVESGILDYPVEYLLSLDRSLDLAQELATVHLVAFHNPAVAWKVDIDNPVQFLQSLELVLGSSTDQNLFCSIELIMSVCSGCMNASRVWFTNQVDRRNGAWRDGNSSTLFNVTKRSRDGQT